MAMDAEQHKRAERVCRLVWREGDKEDGNVKKIGTGFLWGNGWIVTNSHVVGPNAENLPRIFVEFAHNRQPPIQLDRRPDRLCYFVRIRDGEEADFEHADLAMFELEDEKKQEPSEEQELSEKEELIEKKEHTEKQRLSEAKIVGMDHADIGALEEHNSLPLLNLHSKTYCLHYGLTGGKDPGNEAKLSKETVDATFVSRAKLPAKDFEEVPEISRPAEQLVFLRTGGTTYGGSSGSPVFYENGKLCGVHFAGTKTQKAYAINANAVQLFVTHLGRATCAIKQLKCFEEGEIRLKQRQDDDLAATCRKMAQDSYTSIELSLLNTAKFLGNDVRVYCRFNEDRIVGQSEDRIVDQPCCARCCTVC